MDSSNVHFQRQDCLKEIFKQARKGTCLFTRIERRNKQRVKLLLDDITKFVYKRDDRFGKVHTKCSGKMKFNVYWELNIGEENQSMYLHKGGVAVTSIGLEAESKEVWEDEITKHGEAHYLNAHAVNVLLHMHLSKALSEYSKSNMWKERMQDSGLHSIGLQEVNIVHLFFTNELNSKKKEILIHLIPTIKIHKYCMPYARKWFGENITHFIAQPNFSSTSSHPSLQWTSSYHEQEYITMTTFPTKMTLESFYGSLILVTSDPILKLLSRDIIVHVYLETIKHMGRWLEMNFGSGQHFKEPDHAAMMENFFRNLRQKLESNFIPNYYNPEINLLEMFGLDYNQIVLIINKLKSILRGNCECCRGSLQKTLNKFEPRKI